MLGFQGEGGRGGAGGGEWGKAGTEDSIFEEPVNNVPKRKPSPEQQENENRRTSRQARKASYSFHNTLNGKRVWGQGPWPLSTPSHVFFIIHRGIRSKGRDPNPRQWLSRGSGYKKGAFQGFRTLEPLNPKPQTPNRQQATKDSPMLQALSASCNVPRGEFEMPEAPNPARFPLNRNPRPETLNNPQTSAPEPPPPKSLLAQNPFASQIRPPLRSPKPPEKQAVQFPQRCCDGRGYSLT